MKRLRLYLRYKSQQVLPSEIAYNEDTCAEENYKRLYLVRLRLCRCLQARREVYDLYGDEDAGHATAIRFVKIQLNQVDQLLQEACQHMLKAKDTKEIEEDADPAGAMGAEGTKGTEEEEHTSPPKPIAKTCQRLQDESEMLQAIADEGYERAVDAYKRMIHIISTDPNITSDMRQMLLAAEQRRNDDVFHIVQVIAIRVVSSPPASFIESKASYMATCESADRSAYFYHTEVTDEMLKPAIYEFQTHLVSKRRLVEQIATSQSERARRFAFCLFKAIFSTASGQYTTEESVQFILTLACIVDAMSIGNCRHLDDINRKIFCKTHGNEAIDQVEKGIRRMIIMCKGEKDAWPSNHNLPWAFFRHGFCGLFFQYSILATAVLVNNADKQPFLYEIRVRKQKS